MKHDYVNGFDVSHWNVDFNFQKAKENGYEFCFIKSTEGTISDKLCTKHAELAINAGLKIGFYHFFNPKKFGVTQEAYNIVNAISYLSKFNPKLPFMIDVEFLNFKKDIYPTWQELIKLVNNLQMLTYDMDVKFGLYISWYFFNEKYNKNPIRGIPPGKESSYIPSIEEDENFLKGISILKEFFKYSWVPRYSVLFPHIIAPIFSQWDFWQYTDAKLHLDISEKHFDGNYYRGNLKEFNNEFK